MEPLRAPSVNLSTDFRGPHVGSLSQLSWRALSKPEIRPVIMKALTPIRVLGLHIYEP